MEKKNKHYIKLLIFLMIMLNGCSHHNLDFDPATTILKLIIKEEKKK